MKLGPADATARADQTQPNNTFAPLELPKAYWFGQVSSGTFSEVPFSLMERSVPTISLERLETVWQKLIARHDMMRAIVRPDGQCEVLASVPKFKINTLDLRGDAQDMADLRVRLLHDEVLSRERPLDRWPLFEVAAALMPDGTTRVFVGFCGVAIDMFSWVLIEREATALYHDLDAQLPALPRTYVDHVTQTSRAESLPEHHRALSYWGDRIASLPGGPLLPAARPPRPKQWVHHEFRLSREQGAAFKLAARYLGVNKSALATACFSEAIATWAKSRHFVLTMLVNTRPANFAPVIGNFSSTLALEIDFRGTQSFRDRTRALHRRMLKDLEHSSVSGIYVGREINRLYGRKPTALFPVAFSSLWIGSKGGAPTQPRILGSYVRRSLRVPDVSLDAMMTEHFDGSIACNIDARDDVFAVGFLDDLMAAFRQLLLDVAANPGIADQARPVPIPERDRALFAEMNRTELELEDRLLHELFLEQAVKRPSATAVISPDRSLTYEELDRKSLALACRLRAHGVGPNQVVAVPMVRGWQQIVAVLAIHRAGAAYLPIDLSLVPHDRLVYIFQHAGVRVAITQPDAAAAIDWPADTVIVSVEDATPPTPDTAEMTWPLPTPASIAYIIYTSGSTGQPKGVTIDHRGAVNTVLDINQRFNVTERDRVLALSSLGFDLSVWDIFGTFAAGGTLVIPPASDRPDPAKWADAARAHGVTIWNSVPKLLEIMIESIGERTELWPNTLRLAMLSGDWIPLTLPPRVRAVSRDVEIISLGGATEASIWSIYFPIGAIDPTWSSIPYGRPLANQTFFVLDDALAQRPVWATGELYIGGIGLAKGYWRDEGKTAAAFIVHPETGERLYRTGDLGRYMPDGNIEFLGREDSQIKVRGYRVELGEIEAVIAKIPGVREAYVLAREASATRAMEHRRRVSDVDTMRPSDRAADKQLIAYVTLEPGAKVDSTDLRSRVAEKLPDYMVPTFFAILNGSQIPRSPNGKVNRRELPPPSEIQSVHRAPPSRPNDALEQNLHSLFCRLLGVEEVGIDDSFFELGGDSVSLIRVLAAIRKEYGREITVAAFALDPRISSVARMLRDAPSEHIVQHSLITLRRDGVRKPLFLVHPVGGSGLVYLALARHIDPERPVYALQACGLESDEPPLKSIHEMASAYLAELKTIQPTGPYLLGGWSLGGTIAFEMAGQLQDQGEQASVLMIDSWAPQGEAVTGPVPNATMREWFQRDVAQVSDLVPTSATVSDTAAIATRRRYDVYAANVRAVLAYEPRCRPFKVALVRAATVLTAMGEHPALRRPMLEDRVLGWARLSEQPIEVRSAPGDHYTMFASGHIATLAAQVDECLGLLDPDFRAAAQPRRAKTASRPISSHG